MRTMTMTSESGRFLDILVADDLYSDDDSDEEDETAVLMAELAKIKRERAEEKARLVSTSLPSSFSSDLLRTPKPTQPTPATENQR